MQNSKRPLKKIHLTKGFARRGLSFLLSLCMMASLFGGVITFPAFAQGPDQESKQTALAAGTQKELQQDTRAVASTESRETIKARLMRQARNGWDPYSATGMSMDEFYALMELFQEGSLPLDNSVTEIIDKGPATEDPNAEGPDAEEPGTEDPNAEEPGTEDPDAEEPGTEDPDTEEPGTEDPVAEDPDAGNPGTGLPSFDGPSFDGPSFDLPSTDEPSFDGPTIADEPGTGDLDPIDPSGGGDTTATAYIPRELFLFSGLYYDGEKRQETDKDGNPVYEADGTTPKMKDVTSYPAESNTYGYVLEYDNRDGNIDDGYAPGLQPYGAYYTRPPKDWPGLPAGGTGTSMETVITKDGVNDGNPAIAEDCNVIQDLFLAYKDVYVRRVTAQNNDVTVLGAIMQPKKNPNDPETWVYYYTTREGQLTNVSATTLREGQKFVIQYVHREYTISYQIRYRVDSLGEDGNTNLWGYDLVRTPENYPFKYCDTWEEYVKYCEGENLTPDVADWVRQLPRLKHEADRAKLALDIFGTEFPRTTDEGRYAITATAPAGYTLAFYLSDSMKDASGNGTRDTWENGQAMLVTPEGYDGKAGKYKDVNQGWALGMDPVYYYETKTGVEKMMPNVEKGPEELVTTGTFYNNNVNADRIVVAVLRKKPAPEFNAYDLINGTGKDGKSPNTNSNVKGRGTSAKPIVPALIKGTKEEMDDPIPYDYEDVYLWANGGASKYDYNADKIGTSQGNLGNGNVATIDEWNWNKDGKTLNDAVKHKMTQETDQETDETSKKAETYTYRWTWQTNNDNEYVLDTLDINRTGITIPFFVKDSRVANKEGDVAKPGRDPSDPEDMGGAGTWFAKTKLPDGALILVECLMQFNSNNNSQRVYRITVTGARNNITVTNMNLMQYNSGAPEIAVYELDGVTGATEKGEDGRDSGVRRTSIQFYDKGTNKGWSENINRGSVHVDDDNGTDYNGDPTVGGANVRFKLASGYSSPAYLLEDKAGDPVGDMASIERDGDGDLLRSKQYPVVPYISDGSKPYMKYYSDLTPPQKEALKGYENPIGDSFVESNASGNDDPIPVDKNGDLLYYYDGGKFKIFTDWTILRVYDDDTLAPTLYKSDKTELNKGEVIVPKTGCVFGEDMPPMKTQYIYSDMNGWHYIHLEDHSAEPYKVKMALLTIVAYPTRYVIRYKPIDIPNYPVGSEGDDVEVPTHAPEGMPEITHFKETCPTFLQGTPTDGRDPKQFDDNGGAFYDVEVHTDVALNTTKPYDPEKDKRFLFSGWQLVDEFDKPIKVYVKDANGNPVPDPNDPSKNLTTEVVFTSGSFNIRDYADYAIFNSDLGAIDDDIYVLRLIPVWEPVEKPYNYKVALRWVDAQGTLHSNYFDDESEGSLWQSVLTDFDQDKGKGPTVKILTNGEPLLNWIALHPTYTFWDPVNNAVDGGRFDATVGRSTKIVDFETNEFLLDKNEKWDFMNTLVSKDPGDPEEEEKLFLGGLEDDQLCAGEKVVKALLEYFPVLDEASASDKDKIDWKSNFIKVYNAIFQRDREQYKNDEDHEKYYKEGDDFEPLGNYTYAVYEDYGTIVVWMFEDKGRLIFHKSVDAEPFIANEEFYFTVVQVEVGSDGASLLNGTYKAYPEKVYDEHTGEERDIKDSDAWLVTFENGNVKSIVKKGASASTAKNYFTVKNGEGIQLYVPAGTFTIAELGSKSGGSYRTEVTFVASKDDTDKGIKKGMEILPELENGEELDPSLTSYQWLKGTSQQYIDTEKGTLPEGVAQAKTKVKFEVGENAVNYIVNFSNQTSSVAIESLVVGPYGGETLGYDVTLKLPAGTEPLKGTDEKGNEYYYFNFNLYGVTYGEGEKADYKPKQEDLNLDLTNAPPAKGTTDYQTWLKEKQADWLGSDPYEEWLAWHTWRPEGTTEVTTTGRLVVNKGEADGNGVNWVATTVLIPEYYETGGNQSGWKDVTYSGAGAIGLRSGQRFYVVCTVPEQGGEINYYIYETSAQGYKADATRDRDGKAAAAELAYELFINTKLAGMPKTGGMGDGAFRVTGLTFLASGLGLAWLNRDLLERRKRESVPAEEKGWGK